LLQAFARQPKHVSARRWLRALSIVFVAIPFAFASIRAVRTTGDLRYIWVACGSILGAAVVTAAARSYSSTRVRAVKVSAAAFVAATLCAVLVALMLGTRLGPGILIVGSAFGFCCAAGCLLHTLARSDVR